MYFNILRKRYMYIYRDAQIIRIDLVGIIFEILITFSKIFANKIYIEVMCRKCLLTKLCYFIIYSSNINNCFFRLHCN